MERRFTVWVDGGEMNDHYLTKKEAESLAANCKATGYDNIIIEELKGSVTASAFIEWYFSDESDYRDLGRDVAHALKESGYYNMTVKRLFDSCGYIPEHICESFNKVYEEDFIEYEPNDLIFIDDITSVGTCSKCHQSFSGDVDFCNNCGNCVS